MKNSNLCKKTVRKVTKLELEHRTSILKHFFISSNVITLGKRVSRQLCVKREEALPVSLKPAQILLSLCQMKGKSGKKGSWSTRVWAGCRVTGLLLCIWFKYNLTCYSKPHFPWISKHSWSKKETCTHSWMPLVSDTIQVTQAIPYSAFSRVVVVWI